MVIFGAGASFDSALGDAGNPIDRPPLAQQLFDDRGAFNDALAKYPACRPLVGHLRDLQRHEPPPVIEDVLADFLTRSEHNVETRRQLLALRFYLREAIANQTASWMQQIAGLTHYGRLLRRIGDWRAEVGEQVVLITLNYDEMLDVALEEQLATEAPFTNVAGYVERDDWKLCKLHGSTDWIRRIRLPGLATDADNATCAIASAEALDLTAGEIVRQSLPEAVTEIDDFEVELSVPAIAVPTTGKTTFETHQSHIEAFETAVPNVDRLLLVGWRGAEQHVLTRLKAINPHYVLGIVDPHADDVFVQLESAEILQLGNGKTANVGNRSVRRYWWSSFSDLVHGNDVDEWLRIQLPTRSHYRTELELWAERRRD